MAVIKFNNGKKTNISHDKSIEIWNVLNGIVTATPEQEKFCSTIQNIYLAWREAPDSYIEQRIDSIMPSVFGEWSCSKDGGIGRPESNHAWKFAKRWGLWSYGSPTEKAKMFWSKYA